MDGNPEEKTQTENSFDDSAFENVERPNPYPTSSESSFDNPQTPMPIRRRSPKKILYVLGAVVVVLIVLNAVRLIGSKAKSPTPSPSATPSISLETSSPVPSEAPTVTPEPTKAPVSPIDKATGLDRSKLSVSVQNGSGEAGVAGKMADLLKSLGYNVNSTGNADNFTYTNVTIKVKDSQKSFLPLLNKDLSSNNYSVGSTSSDLTATSSADALVIVGK